MKNKYLTKVIQEQITKNSDILESLRDHDEGKKIISTIALEKRFPGIKLHSSEI